jgi:hypothetical protein
MADRLKKKPATRRDRDDAQRLQAAGTHGDTVLAHINPQEAHLLDVLADGLADGGGHNPTSGLLSFGMSDAESGGFGGSSGNDSNPGGYGGGPAGGNTGGGLGGNTSDGSGGMSGNNYGVTEAQYASIAKQLNDDIDSNYQGMFGTGFTDRTDGWGRPDTGYRALQEAWYGPAYNAPGRYGMPTGIGPGVVGTAIGSMVGGPMSLGMRMGDAMGRAQSQQERDNTAAGFGALGAHNSTGQDRNSSDGLGSRSAGLVSGSAGLLGGTDSGAHTKSGLPQPVENLLMDYVWRGRQGKGLLGW